MCLRLPQVSIQKIEIHELLRRLICTFDGKARAGVGQGVNPTPRPQRAIISTTNKEGRVMVCFKRAVARIEAHWFADLLGAVALFALLIGGLFVAHGAGL